MILHEELEKVFYVWLVLFCCFFLHGVGKGDIRDFDVVLAVSKMTKESLEPEFLVFSCLASKF